MGDIATQQNEQQDLLDDEGKPAPEIIDEVDIVLETEEEEEEKPPVKRNPIKDMRKRIKDQNRENKDLNKENEALRAALQQQETTQQQQPVKTDATGDDPRPLLQDYGYDAEKFQQEYDAWNERNIEAIVDRRLAKETESGAKSAAAQDAETAIQGHYERAGHLKVANYEEVEDAAITAMGPDLIQSIQTTVDNSETLIYWLGCNPERAAQLSEQFKANPGKATFELGKLSSQLTLRPKGKTPPNPDLPVRGGGGAINTNAYNKYLKRLKDAYDATDINEARRVREEAKANGITLPTNQV